jgi:hypothetical protein
MRTRRVFDDNVADVIDPIWGFDEQGEIRGVWKRSGHPGFWVAAGPFWVSRYYSRLLALQIKVVEEGLGNHSLVGCWSNFGYLHLISLYIKIRTFEAKASLDWV